MDKSSNGNMKVVLRTQCGKACFAGQPVYIVSSNYPEQQLKFLGVK